MRKPWVATCESKDEMLRFLDSIVLSAGDSEVFVHPDYFKELCDRLGVKPEDILSEPPEETDDE